MHDPVTTLTNEVYALFMCHLMAGTKESVEYTRLLLEDVKQAKKGEGPHVLWMHMMPFLQAPVKEIFNYQGQMHIRACDFVADGFQKAHHEDPYEAMAEKMVNCIYNGSVEQRIAKANELAQLIDADGGILFAHWGCKGTIGASGLIKNSLEASGLPTIILDGDGCNPANGCAHGQRGWQPRLQSALAAAAPQTPGSGPGPALPSPRRGRRSG